MTREKALEALDKLVDMGYSVQLTERDMSAHGLIFFDRAGGAQTTVSRSLSIVDFSVDKVDLRALVAAADELGLDVGLDRIGNKLTFTDMPSEDEQRKLDVTSGRRPHPR